MFPPSPWRDRYAKLAAHPVGRFLPFFVVLAAAGLVLWILNALGPRAPFIYSLF